MKVLYTTRKLYLLLVKCYTIDNPTDLDSYEKAVVKAALAVEENEVRTTSVEDNAAGEPVSKLARHGKRLK